MFRPLAMYYVATVVFLISDYVLNINVRIAFLEPWPWARAAYYLICFGCLALIVLRPKWATAVSLIESLTVVIALTLSMGIRVMVVSDEMIETGRGSVSGQEMINYLISGSIAYWSYLRGIKALKRTKIA